MNAADGDETRFKSNTSGQNYNPNNYQLLVPFTNVDSVTFDKSTKPIADYIKTIYTYALSIVGILSTIVMMFAGFLWITSGGNASRVQDAQAWIASALTGLVLALFSYTFLYLINPALVKFEPIPIKNAESTTVNSGNTNKTDVKIDESTCRSMTGYVTPSYRDLSLCETYCNVAGIKSFTRIEDITSAKGCCLCNTGVR